MENEEHPVYNALQEKIELVEKELNTKEIPNQTKKSLLVWKDLLAYTSVVLNSKRFPNVPVNFLDELNSTLSSVSANVIRNYQAYSSYYNTILNYTKRIPIVESKGDVRQSFTSLVSQFDTKTANIIDSFKEEQNKSIEAWKQKQISLNEEITALKNSKEEISAQLETLKKDITAQRTANQTMVSDLQTEYNTFKTQKEKSYDSKKEELDKKIIEWEKSFTIQTSKIIENLEEKQKEVEKLWGIIGKAAISGQAQSYADKAQNMADILMWTAFAILIVMTLGLTIITMRDIYRQNFSFLTFFYKVIASAVLLAPAIYCMNLAKRQRDREFQLRDFEVKTTALEPFLERMEFTSDDQKGAKDTVKLELAKVFFDKEFAKENKQHGAILLSDDMLEGLAKLSTIFNSQNNEKK